MTWIKFHEELTKGAKRGIPRATRFIYLELSALARPRAGSVDLPVGMSELDGVRDLIGGDAREIKAALRTLTTPMADGEAPMLRFDGTKGKLTLVVPAWAKWNDKPGGSTQRVREHRERERKGVGTDPKRVTDQFRNTQSDPTETRYTGVAKQRGNGSVTPLEERRAEEIREEKISKSEKKFPHHQPETARAPGASGGGSGLGSTDGLEEETPAGAAILEALTRSSKLKSLATRAFAERCTRHTRDGALVQSEAMLREALAILREVDQVVGDREAANEPVVNLPGFVMERLSRPRRSGGQARGPTGHGRDPRGPLQPFIEPGTYRPVGDGT